MTMSLHIALEQLAFALPRFGAIEQAAMVIAIAYKGEIDMQPVGATSIGRDSKLTDYERTKLIVMIIRDLQEWALAILREKGREPSAADQVTTWLDASQQAIVQSKWDSWHQAPTWTAFERQYAKFRGY